MNTSRLGKTIELLLAAERQFKLQELLVNLADIVEGLVSNPASADVQSAVATSLETFIERWAEFRASLSPAEARSIDEIGGSPYFGPETATDFQRLMTSNTITPAVLRTAVHNLRKKRTNYLERLKVTLNNLHEMGVEELRLEEGETEFGVRFPESLFSNEFKALLKVLNELKLVLRFFNEAIDGSDQNIPVRQISSTDPTFFLGVDPFVLVAIGGTITWFLSTLKQLYEIKKLRNESAKVLKPEDLAVFDNTIQQKIDTAVDERVKQILETIRPGARENLDQGLHYACEQIMAWLERGVTFEIRVAKPATNDDLGEDDQITKVIFEELEVISKQLTFPRVEGPPVIKLPRSPDAPDKNPQLAAN